MASSSPCESDVLTRLDHGPIEGDVKASDICFCRYFFRPTDRFFSLRSDDLHFLHLAA